MDMIVYDHLISETNQPTRLKRGLILAGEVALIVTIVALLVAIWLPAWVVPH